MSDGVAERVRLAQADSGEQPWRAWGPYLAERAWGTVREDYSEHGTAWDYFPHDHARSRAYRWNDDGMAGICDDRQTFCFALALWNGEDPILKERMFGLGGDGGNHGEDAKEYWWYQDSTPTHSWMRWRYHYPQAAFPYDELVRVNGHRSREEPEYELVDTGIFDDDRFWAVTVDYAKADADRHVHRHHRGQPRAGRGDPARAAHALVPQHLVVGAAEPSGALDRRLRRAGSSAGTAASAAWSCEAEDEPPALLCDNETNAQRLWGMPGTSLYPKDGINDHVVAGAPTVNPAGVGTKGAFHYRADACAGGEPRQIRLRLTQCDDDPAADRLRRGLPWSRARRPRPTTISPI